MSTVQNNASPRPQARPLAPVALAKPVVTATPGDARVVARPPARPEHVKVERFQAHGLRRVAGHVITLVGPTAGMIAGGMMLSAAPAAGIASFVLGFGGLAAGVFGGLAVATLGQKLLRPDREWPDAAMMGLGENLDVFGYMLATCTIIGIPFVIGWVEKRNWD